jgi:hypothetical protein
MSTLVAQTISNGTVSTSSANVIQGSAKAWVNFNGAGVPAIRASYNVSSITDNGAGLYTVNFPAGVFADGSYAVSSCAGWGAAGAPTNSFICAISPTTAPTSTALALGVYISTGGAGEPNFVNVSCFR